MPTNTTRLALVQPAGSDAPVVLRTSIAGNATILDAAVRIFEGTLVARSLVTPAYGDEYYATDTLQWFKYNGSAWLLMLVAGAWVTPTLHGAWTTTGLKMRLDGDIVHFQGQVTNSSGSPVSAGQVLTTPSGMDPASGQRRFIAPTDTGSFTAFDTTTGFLNIYTNGNPLAIGATVWFDGCSYVM
jgi:hypothetical protein